MVYRVIRIISGGFNQSLFVFFYVVSSRYIDVSTLTLMLASPLPPSFVDTYSLSTSSLPYAWSLVFLFFDPFV